MQKIKIVELIYKIPSSDLERLCELIKFSKKIKPEIMMLFNEIIRNINSIEKNKKQNLWKAVYGKEKLNDNHFRKLCFELLHEVEDALGIIQLEKDKNAIKIQTLNYFANHKIDNFYEEKWNKLKLFTTNNSTKWSSKQAFFEYNFELLQYDYLISSSSKINNISDTSHALDDYYILQKMKLLCHSINESKFTNYNELPSYYNVVIDMAVKSKENPLTSLYLSIYYLISNKTTINIFTEIKESLETLVDIDEDELRIVFQYIINYCIIKINNGEINFEPELFHIYKKYIEKIHDKIFSPFRYKNIINISLKLKEYKFAEDFIDNYGKKLPDKLQQTTIAFNKAKLQYELKEYNAVIDILKVVKNEDLIFNLSSKVLLVKTFYEKKEFQLLDSFLESFRIFVLRNKEMNTASKKIHQDFIKIINRLIKMEYASIKEIEAFKNKILNLDNLPDKAWILEKIELL